MATKRYIVEVEKAEPEREGKPSAGPAYRSLFAKDGFPQPVEGMETCWDVFRMSVERCPENRMLGRREVVNGKPGGYIWMTYKQVYDVVMRLGNSIRSCGVSQGGRCGIYGANCTEWIMSMEACNAHGIYCVPLYDTLGMQRFANMWADISLGAGAVEFIICHAEVSIAFVEEKKIAEVLKTCPKSTEFLKTLVSFGKVAPEQKEEAEKFGLAIYSWDEFLTLGDNQQFDLPVTKKDGISTIMYTSGTTGDPKGVLISHESIITLIAGVKQLLSSVNEQLDFKDVYLSYLPLAHIFDRVIEELFISIGASIGFWRGVKQGLGGNVRLILSGAAPLATHVEAFLRVVACCHVVQGYGLTETCAGTFVSLPNEPSMLGTVGPPVPNVDVRLESVPEMGYDALSNVPRGEICVKGNTLFSGYYKREDLTKEVMDDGWFHTGDIGEWQPNGSLKIIDRKKNIFKLSQGEYVAVENLENIYGLVSAIDSRWAEENGESGDFTSLCENPKAKAYILGELTKIAKEKKLKGFEVIKAVHLDPLPFDMERDLLTPTYKKKRPQLLKYYQGIIDGLYKSPK
ncbi:Long chain acyl-CoA synthetase 4 [Acorus calamus]|uniref:4-coumarate--CoA ligase n=1 Tax=Acorus calamus TaxID=4465 RepID=A0AAV9C825_ACOCL|nr:Long chain acyl-CoA synthetase 4 [Acorus calamus]